jgi:hypothetical protein
MKTTLLFLMVLAMPWLTAAGEKTASARLFVVVVGGITRDADLKSAQDNAESRLLALFGGPFEKNPIRASFLVDDPSPIRHAAMKADRGNIRQMLTDLAKLITPADRFLFYYVGQANLVLDQLRFNIPGDDFTRDDLAAWLKPMTAADQVIILDCPAAGSAVKVLAAPGRIIVGAARGDQPYATCFSDYFLPAWRDAASDINQDGRVSLLEAFQRAAGQVDEFYRGQELMAAEIPILDDNADGAPSQQPWRFNDDHDDGARAAMWFLPGK